MTERTLLKQTQKDNKEEEGYYLISFEDNTYSLATKKMISFEGEEVGLGAKAKVKTGGKFHMGYLVNFGSKEDMERVIKIQYPAGEKQKCQGQTAKRKTECDHPSSKKPTKEYDPENDDAVYNSQESESEDDQDPLLLKEREKMERLISNLGKKPIANIPAPKEISPAASSHQMHQKLLHLEHEVKTIKASLEGLKQKVCSIVPAAAAFSPKSPPSFPKLNETEVVSPPAAVGNSKPEIWHNGINLSNVKAPPKEPQKCALQLMDKLFTRKELSEGILFESKRSTKQPLDEARVTKMFDVLNANYSNEKIQKYRQAIIDACNQKCRDVARSSKEQSH